MIKTTMIKVSQKSLNINVLNELYSALEEEMLTIKRIFDPRYSFSGDDLIIEGEIDDVLGKLSQDLPRIIAIRFSKQDYTELVNKRAAINLKHGLTTIFFGTTLVDYEFLFQKLRVDEKRKILSLLFRTQLGGKFVSLMPVKVKGIVISNSSDKTIEFILPTQRIQTLKAWLNMISQREKIDFDALVDIYRETDPVMRRNMEETMNWISVQLPEIVAKSTNIENVDIVRAYQRTLALM